MEGCVKIRFCVLAQLGEKGHRHVNAALRDEEDAQYIILLLQHAV
jgi:hypothetical protein